MPSLPYPQSEACFRKYEHAIAQAVDKYPMVVCLSDKFEIPDAHTTFIARFRDAEKSYLTYNWVCDFIDREKFLLVSSFLQIVSHEGKIYTGDRISIQELKRKPSSKPKTKPSLDSFPISERDPGILLYLAKLCSLGLLSRPLSLTNLTEENAQMIRDTYDVLLRKDDETGVYTLIP